MGRKVKDLTPRNVYRMFFTSAAREPGTWLSTCLRMLYTCLREHQSPSATYCTGFLSPKEYASMSKSKHSRCFATVTSDRTCE